MLWMVDLRYGQYAHVMDGRPTLWTVGPHFHYAIIDTTNIPIMCTKLDALTKLYPIVVTTLPGVIIMGIIHHFMRDQHTRTVLLPQSKASILV